MRAHLQLRQVRYGEPNRETHPALQSSASYGVFAEHNLRCGDFCRAVKLLAVLGRAVDLDELGEVATGYVARASMFEAFKGHNVIPPFQ